MGGVQLTGDWSGLFKAFDGLGQFGLLGRLHKQIAEYGVSSTKLRFREERDPAGKRWIPSLRALRTGGQTLTDTGRLRGSITGRGDEKRAEWGSNVIYARVHQFGGRLMRGRRQGGLPARPYLGLNDDDKLAIEEIIAEGLAEAAR